MCSRRVGGRMNGYVSESDKRPTQAVAIHYDPENDNAPRVIASGQGAVAEQIIELARQHGIFVHQDPALTAALASIDIDSVIPLELYAVVAEVLAFAYRIQQR